MHSKLTKTALIPLLIFVLYISSSSLLFSQTAEKIASGFVFPEGPSFDAQGNLYVVDCQTKNITKITPDGKSSVFVTLPGKTNGSIIDSKGVLILAGWDTRKVLKVLPDGTFSIYLETFEGKPLQGPNDFAFDPKGRLYFSDPLYDKDSTKCSRVLYVDTDGAVKHLVDIPGYTNGLAFAKDPSILYVAETIKKQVWKITVNPNGTMKDKSIFISLESTDGPDGMKVDVNGNLYVAAYGSGFVRCINPEGKIIKSIPVPAKNVTNLVFGGPNNDDIYVTETSTGCVYKIHVGAQGLVKPGKK